jgi:nicotinamide mononucleotide transporter
MGQLLEALQQPVIGPITWAELWGDVTGLLCVWLVARQHLWNWPIGILNNAFFFILFWWSKLYGDAVLQLAFAAIGFYGWWNWVWGKGVVAGALPVRRTTALEWLVLAGTTCLTTVIVTWWLAHHTDSPVPLWDSSVLTLSLAATYGQAKKLLESWWLWILVDVLSIPLYVVRGLYPTAVLYALFLALCIVGLRAWQRELPRPPVTEGEGA